jgi:sugar phosphate isomerase/epimerase
MSDTEQPLFLVSWFPGISRPEVLARLKDAGIDGIELRHVDEESRRIADAGFLVSFHLPFLKDGTPQEINLVNERILAPYREGRMAGLALSPLPYVGYHFGYSALEIEKQRNGPDTALTPTLPRAEVAARMRPIVAELAVQIGKQVLLENVDYGPTGAVEYVCEPAFLRECAEAWGCGTLLDVAHERAVVAPEGDEQRRRRGEVVTAHHASGGVRQREIRGGGAERRHAGGRLHHGGTS